ncbi:DNA-binding protein [Calothrix sp. HK-06]|nr:DNA-binding protein [Calothrix sp. HK-06]
MKAKVYVETSVISYLTSRPNRDVVIAGHQQTTRDWWENRKEAFNIVASELVIREVSAGDTIAVQERLKVLSGIELLEFTEEAVSLGQKLVETGILPKKATDDAFHIAIAVTNGVDYLLTWNCKHIANVTIRQQVERFCRSRGYEPVAICTPEELLEA